MRRTATEYEHVSGQVHRCSVGTQSETAGKSCDVLFLHSGAGGARVKRRWVRCVHRVSGRDVDLIFRNHRYFRIAVSVLGRCAIHRLRVGRCHVCLILSGGGIVARFAFIHVVENLYFSTFYPRSRLVLALCDVWWHVDRVGSRFVVLCRHVNLPCKNVNPTALAWRALRPAVTHAHESEPSRQF